jgi:hypothetical protein
MPQSNAQGRAQIRATLTIHPRRPADGANLRLSAHKRLWESDGLINPQIAHHA